jgi:hypothetical protein
MRIASLAGALALALAFAAAAQAPLRVRGTVAAFDGHVLRVDDTTGNAREIVVSERTELVFAKPLALGDIRPGDFVACTSKAGADGRLVASEVRRFAKPVNPGHRPFSGGANQMMTNATVATATVQAAGGRELALAYEGGSQKIVVPEGAAVFDLVAAERSQLAAGMQVNLTATPDDQGKLAARRIEFRK